MNGLNATTLRKLIPAFAVTGILGLAALAPSGAMGAADVVGYGYGNNCGVKGNGTHDHGKACPNRPFPGKGKGLIKASEQPGTNETSTEGGSSTTTSNDATTTSASTTVTLNETTTAASAGTTSSDQDTLSAGHKGHGKGHGRGRRDG